MKEQIVEVSQHMRVTEAVQLGFGDSAQGQETPIHKVEAVSQLLVVKAPRSLAGTPTWHSVELVLPGCRQAYTPGLHLHVLESLKANEERKAPTLQTRAILP